MRGEHTRVEPSTETATHEARVEPIETEIAAPSETVVGSSHVNDLKGSLEDLEDSPPDSPEINLRIRQPKPKPKPTI